MSILFVFTLHSESLHRPRKKIFSSPSAPTRVAGYKLLTEFDI